VANNIKILPLLGIMLVLGMSACAHQSKIKPSNGHIDGQNTPTHQTADNSVATKSANASIPKPVTSNTYLPPPKPKTKAQLYSIVVYDTPVKEVLFAIARDSKLNIDIHPSIQGRVTLNAVDQTLPAILERLSKQVDLTYKIQGNVLSITPDQPVLKTYKVDYVNMSRDTTGEVGVASEIASTGSGAVGSEAGTTNSSKTSVKSIANNHFWTTLIANIKDILAETDKEVIVSRFGSLATTESEASSKGKASTSGDKNATDAGKSSAEQREEQRSEYKTLFAANVIANPETGIISVRGTNKQHERVQEFLDQVMTSAKRQVLIEATIVEVQLSDEFQAGIDWSRLAKSGFIFSQALGPQIVAAGLIAKGIVAPDRGIVAGYASQNGNVLASVQLLEKFGNTKVLSSPKLMVLNNQTGILKVVKNRVYFTTKSEITPATTALSEPIVSVTATPHTVPIGIVMSVTPQITGGDMVNINVRPTISREIGNGVIDPTPSLNGKSTIPEIQVQEMESLLQISSGNTAVLGGLMQDQLKADSEGVPGLSKVPGVGKAFTGRDESTVKTELVIFLRPTVIKNASLESDELSSYKQYLPSQALETEAENER
jgi:MSHA biogenesis protein MshL